MPVLKHVEYKAVCYTCFADLTEYVTADSKKEALDIFRRYHGVEPHNGLLLCEGCKQKRINNLKSDTHESN